MTFKISGKLKCFHRGIWALSIGLSLFTAAANVDAQAVKENTEIVQNLAATSVLELKNSDKSGRLKAVSVELVQPKISVKADLNFGCPEPQQTTNQATQGQYLESVLFGFGTGADSFWAKAVFQNEKLDVRTFSGTETVNADISVFDSTLYGVRPVDQFLARANKFAEDRDKLVAFFKNTQKYAMEYPLRFEMICRDYMRNDVTKKVKLGEQKSYVHLRKLSVPVRYVGDVRLQGTGMKRLKMTGSITAPTAPKIARFKLDPPVIVQGPKNLRGVCPLKAGFRLKISGQEQGIFRLIIKSDRDVLYTSEPQKFRGREMEVGFELPQEKAANVALYQQVLRKITVELQGKPKSQAAAQFYAVRRTSNPFLWQYTCINQ